MKIRLWTALAVSGLAVMALLSLICRVPAGEILVPTMMQTPSTDVTVLPALGSSVPVPVYVEVGAAPAEESKPLPPLPSTSVVPVRLETTEGKQGGSLMFDVAVIPAATPAIKPTIPEPPSVVAEPMPKIPSMLVHSRKIKLNFNITDVGPSGVSAVELWATRDGHAWQRYSNEPPPSGPLVVCVAEEGKYGFSIVVRNGVGVASPAPKTGDAPQMWVEVDETKPLVALTECRVIHGTDVAHLQVGWKASDVNMVAKPITISTSPSKDGPWTPAVSAIENSGTYNWEMPKDVPYQFFVRVEAADKAGHIGTAVTHEPIKVDACRPRGTILGVDAENKPVSKATTPEEQKPVFNMHIGWMR